MKQTTSRKLTCAYIYTDGTLFEVFEESRNFVKIADTVDVTLGYCSLRIDKREGGDHYKQGVPFGRIVIGRHYGRNGFIELARGGKIQATLPSIVNGSPNSQEKGIAVQYLKLITAKGAELNWTETPSIICGQFTIQDDSRLTEIKPEELIPGNSWGSCRIWKVKDLRPKPVFEAAQVETTAVSCAR